MKPEAIKKKKTEFDNEDYDDLDIWNDTKSSSAVDSSKEDSRARKITPA